MAKKKEKIIWVDDGRTVADMSGVGSALNGKAKAPKATSAGKAADIFRHHGLHAAANAVHHGSRRRRVPYFLVAVLTHK